MPIDFQKLKEDTERYNIEKCRVKTILNNKYKNDPEFRQKCIDRNREYRLKLKLLKQNTNNNICNENASSIST